MVDFEAACAFFYTIKDCLVVQKDATATPGELQCSLQVLNLALDKAAEALGISISRPHLLRFEERRLREGPFKLDTRELKLFELLVSIIDHFVAGYMRYGEEKAKFFQLERLENFPRNMDSVIRAVQSQQKLLEQVVELLKLQAKKGDQDGN